MLIQETSCYEENNPHFIMPSVLDIIQNLHPSEATFNTTLLKWEAEKRN